VPSDVVGVEAAVADALEFAFVQDTERVDEHGAGLELRVGVERVGGNVGGVL